MRLSWLKIVGLIVSAIVLFVACYFVKTIPPTETSYYPRCGFFTVTGLHCPGCGGFRAWHELLNGRVQSALHYNVLAVTLVPAMMAWVTMQQIGLSSWRRESTSDAKPSRRLRAIVLWSIVFIVVAFGILRNLPYPPYNKLAPPSTIDRIPGK